MPLKLSTEEILDEIARQLCQSYVTISAASFIKEESASKNELNSLSEKVFEKQNKNGLTFCRNILIVGAGASKNCLHLMPDGRETKKILFDILGLDQLIKNKHNIPLLQKMYDISLRILGTRDPGRLGDYPLRLKSEKNIKTGKTEANLEKLRDIWLHEENFDFESFFQLVLTFCDEKTIREKLSNIFEIQYTPVLFYEIVAHLFKHGFIDFIINFNFDELLDRAIREEMGTGNYHYIYSDGTCKTMKDISVDDRLKVPVYIKPHGTISHKSSMRFTKDHYYDIPDEISLLLSDVLSGKLASDTDSTRTIKKINLFSVGFKFESVEFNAILRKTLVGSKKNNDFQINIFSITNSRAPSSLAELEKTEGKKVKVHSLLIAEYEKNKNIASFFSKALDRKDTEFITIDRFGNSNELSILFWDIFFRIKTSFKKHYQPRGIKHHALIHYLFYPGKDVFQLFEEFEYVKNKYNSKDFYLQRTIMEFAIIVAKNRGKFEIKTAINERIKIVYDLYKRGFEKDANKSRKNVITLSQIAEFFFDMEEGFSFAKNLYNIRPVKCTLPEVEILITELGWENKAIEKNKRENFGNRLMIKLLSTTDRLKRQKSEGETINDFIIDAAELALNQIFPKDKSWKLTVETTALLINEIAKEVYEEVSPEFDDVETYTFNSLDSQQILHTWLSFQYRIQETLSQSDRPNACTHLFIVSDSGKLIFTQIDFDKLPELKYIYLICSMEVIKRYTHEHETIDEIIKRYINSLKKDLPEKIFDKITLSVSCLPFYDHNRHMYMFIRKEGSEIQHLRSISYYKRGFSNKINPIWIKGTIDGTISDEAKRDHKMLYEIFETYHKKGLIYKISNGNQLYVLQRNINKKTENEDTVRKDIDIPGIEEYCEADNKKKALYEKRMNESMIQLLEKSSLNEKSKPGF